MGIQPDGTYNLHTENAETRKEIDIRGRMMMFACDIEYCLLNIVAFCSTNPYGGREGQFYSMRMRNKIDNAICDIKKHNMVYYLEFKESFDALETFIKVRNDMAHHKGDFPKGDLSIFKVVFVDKDDRGKEGLKGKLYTDEIIVSLYNLFAVTNARLSSLWFRLKEEFDVLHPLVHPEAGNGLPNTL